MPSQNKAIYNAIGLMSGTSLDGVDVAWLETDGKSYVFARESHYIPYDQALRDRVRACFGLRQRTPDVTTVERDLTDAHAFAVTEFLRREKLHASDIDVIGFHGQTLTHDPDHEFTWQIGDGEALARATGIPVVYDFRSADVAAGGQGAPLLPVYHRARALSSNVTLPTAILNIGGVSNITWIGKGENDILAFDTGPGNALIDDHILKNTGKNFDENGMHAQSGRINHEILNTWCAAPYFERTPPKSLDRNAWEIHQIGNLSFADAAATLTAFTVETIALGVKACPQKPAALFVSGGGRKNAYIMQLLSEKLGIPVRSVDDLGWDGDAVEAEGFAYLAVRSLLHLPLSLPGTTGVPKPQTGGVLAKP